jgi:hypothetical protein
MRLYAPDLQRYQNWNAPKAEKISRVRWRFSSACLNHKGDKNGNNRKHGYDNDT